MTLSAESKLVLAILGIAKDSFDENEENACKYYATINEMNIMEARDKVHHESQMHYFDQEFIHSGSFFGFEKSEEFSDYCPEYDWFIDEERLQVIAAYAFLKMNALYFIKFTGLVKYLAIRDKLKLTDDEVTCLSKSKHANQLFSQELKTLSAVISLKRLDMLADVVDINDFKSAQELSKVVVINYNEECVIANNILHYVEEIIT